MFDKDYYERGLLTKKSCYDNYRWIPELTIPMAMTIIDHLRIERFDSVLDYGCAKGFLVKALRWLNRNALGYDISEYAIANADPQVRSYVSNKLWNTLQFDFCIAKDVFEHIPEDMLAGIIENDLKKITTFVIVPLVDNGRYRADNNNLDVTHIICQPEEWWLRFFNRLNRQVKEEYRIPGIKDHYSGIPRAHGFFTLL